MGAVVAHAVAGVAVVAHALGFVVVVATVAGIAQVPDPVVGQVHAGRGGRCHAGGCQADSKQ